MKKLLLIAALSFTLSVFSLGPAFAQPWEIVLAPIEFDGGPGIVEQQILFRTDIGGFRLQQINLTIDYSDKLLFSEFVVEDQKESPINDIFKRALWESPLPPFNNGDVVQINANEVPKPLPENEIPGYPLPDFVPPVGDTLLGTIKYVLTSSQTGLELGVWSKHPTYADLVQLDTVTLELGGPEGLEILSEDTIAIVPIPGALWLLGSGLIGLAALRRRFR
jgi:hypothetical protein